MECDQLTVSQLAAALGIALMWLFVLAGVGAMLYGMWKFVKRLKAKRLVVGWADRPEKVKVKKEKTGNAVNMRVIALTAVFTVLVVAALGLVGYMGYLVFTVG